MRRTPATLLVGALLTTLVPLATAFPVQGSPAQARWQSLFMLIFWIAVVVGVLVEGLLLYALIRFRAKKGGPQEGPHIHGNTKMEVAWTLVPALVMGWLLVLSFQGLFIADYPPDNHTDFTVQVTGSQFSWTFQYPDGNQSIGKFRVEQNRVVGFDVRSTDVVHAFSVLGLSVMIDAVPGKVNHFWMQATRAGDYPIRCRELCGVGHSYMLGNLTVFPEGTQSVPWGNPPAPAKLSATPTPTPTPTGNATNSSAPANSTVPPAEGRSVPVTLGAGGEFVFDPAHLTVNVAENVVLDLRNAGGPPHNLFIGKYDPSQPDSGAQWKSADLASGASGHLAFTFDKDQTFEIWCNVGGHYQLGMKGLLVVGKGSTQGPAKEPLLPGFEPWILAVALGIALVVVRRRPSP